MPLSSGYENRRARVEMLPLIDIVFLLLVFFIYAMLSMVVHKGIKVELPGASTSQVDDREYVSITITEKNEIFVDKEPVDMQNLPAMLRDRRSARPDLPVFINSDGRASLGTAIRILDLLRGAGIDEVMFATSGDAK